MARLSGSTHLFRRHTNVAQYRFFPVDCHIYGMASRASQAMAQKIHDEPVGLSGPGPIRP